MKAAIRVPEATLMHREAAEAGDAVARMLAANGEVLRRIGRRLRATPPAVVVTCARGSSDHAATYAKYLIETMTGVVVASAAPSVFSVYHAAAAPAGRLCLAISQSGRSPDLLRAVEAQRTAGAYVVALVNDAGAPLCGLADEVVALSAGPEQSVAATKSFIASLAAIASLVAEWTGDAALATATAALPERLGHAFALDWSPALEVLEGERNLFVIGRGLGMGVAQEAALKLKETAGLHAESISAAEVKHGPMAVVGPGFPVLAFAGGDAAGDDVRETVALFASRGAATLLADATGGTETLPALADHQAIEPILMIASFYRFANALSLRRGLDPDAPPFLNKVTRTR